MWPPCLCTTDIKVNKQGQARGPAPTRVTFSCRMHHSAERRISLLANSLNLCHSEPQAKNHSPVRSLWCVVAPQSGKAKAPTQHASTVILRLRLRMTRWRAFFNPQTPTTDN